MSKVISILKRASNTLSFFSEIIANIIEKLEKFFPQKEEVIEPKEVKKTVKALNSAKNT
ncbi:MAG: hypothetical protein HYR91_06225 [Flavobacteriia bacterium]|nr:hypothetical protein [Flavobacteriia bacterium]